MLTPDVVALLTQIHEYKGEQNNFLGVTADTLTYLVEIAKIQSTEASNKIEGIVTTNTRVQQICADKTTPRNRDEEEIMGYRDVLNTIQRVVKTNASVLITGESGTGKELIAEAVRAAGRDYGVIENYSVKIYLRVYHIISSFTSTGPSRQMRLLPYLVLQEQPMQAPKPQPIRSSKLY